MQFERARQLYESVVGFYRRYLRPIFWASASSSAIGWMIGLPPLLTGILLGLAMFALIGLVGGWLSMPPKTLTPPVSQVADGTPSSKAVIRSTVRAQLEGHLGISNSTGAQLQGQPVVVMGRVRDIDDHTVDIKTFGGERIGVRQSPEDKDLLRTLRRGDVVRVDGKIRYIIRDGTSDHVMLEGEITSPGVV